MTFQGYADTQKAARCRTCGRAIVWMILAGGDRHPFDLPPGQIRLRVVAEHPSLFDDGRTLSDVDATSHFATCAQRQSWRRR